MKKENLKTNKILKKPISEPCSDGISLRNVQRHNTHAKFTQWARLLQHDFHMLHLGRGKDFLFCHFLHPFSPVTPLPPPWWVQGRDGCGHRSSQPGAGAASQSWTCQGRKELCSHCHCQGRVTCSSDTAPCPGGFGMSPCSSVKMFFLTVRWHSLYFSLCPLPLILSQGTAEESGSILLVGTWLGNIYVVFEVLILHYRITESTGLVKTLRLSPNWPNTTSSRPWHAMSAKV